MRTKLRSFNSSMKSVLLYGCETWRTTHDATKDPDILQQTNARGMLVTPVHIRDTRQVLILLLPFVLFIFFILNIIKTTSLFRGRSP